MLGPMSRDLPLPPPMPPRERRSVGGAERILNSSYDMSIRAIKFLIKNRKEIINTLDRLANHVILLPIYITVLIVAYLIFTCFVALFL